MFYNGEADILELFHQYMIIGSSKLLAHIALRIKISISQKNLKK